MKFRGRNVFKAILKKTGNGERIETQTSVPKVHTLSKTLSCPFPDSSSWEFTPLLRR